MTPARNRFRLASALAALSSLTAPSAAADGTEPQSAEFFEKKVRPVLVEHCGRCHGADARKVKGGLRVDSRAALVRGGDSGPAIVPGEAAKSRLVEAVAYKNVELQMPPKGKLPDAVVADLARWVQGGAHWPDERSADSAIRGDFDLARRKAEHWAWKPVRRPEVPAVRDQSWPRGAVDAFLLAKLEEKGLTPAAPADKYTLLRRVTFDLTGLPPAPEAIDAFVKDEAPDAYEKVVDRLLASPAYGERWARHWLDLVRYADTRGHEFDYAAPNAWQYRDYVIRAFNADVPYDRFVAEHVAGDLLAEPRRNPAEGFDESVLGTGFWLLGEEVHSPVDLRQDLADRLDNRIDVLTKAFLGLTVSCARCHDHKFDAVSARDYYALFGILEGASPRLVRFDALEHNRRVAAELARARAESRAALEKALAADAGPAVTRAADYLLAAREALLAGPAPEGPKSGPHAAAVPEFGDAFRKRLTDAAAGRKLDPEILVGWAAAVLAAGRNPDDPLHAWAKVCAEPGTASPGRLAGLLRSVVGRLRQREATAAAALRGADVVIDYATAGAADWLPDEAAFGPGPETVGAVRLGAGPSGVRFAEETAAVYDRAWDGLRGAAGAEEEPGALARVHGAGRTIRTPAFTLTTGKLFYRVRGSGIAYAAVEGHGLIAGPLHGRLVQDVRGGDGFRWVAHDLTPYKGRRAHVEFTPASSSDFAVAGVVQAEREPGDPVRPPRALLDLLAGEGASSAEALAAGYERLFRDLTAQLAGERSAGDGDAPGRARLANWLLGRPALLSGTALREAVGRARAEQAKLAEGVRKESRLALSLLDAGGTDERVFVRGSYKVPGEPAPRRFLEALAGPAPFPAGPGSGRLELARQMTDPALDPLLARVMVNRLWHHLFGRGPVASTDNFGVLGDRPTHPELLDWLADEFVRRGWSIKAMVRTLVLSSAYRMDSRAEGPAESADPQDLLLHRMRLRRLEGEAVRDAILAASGRLDPRPFGPAVAVHLTPFLEGRGRPTSGPLDGDGRRSIYLAVRRNFLSPFLLAFDTPIPFSTVGRRTVSNVPAQALILLNDPFVHRQAELWARRVVAAPGAPGERVRAMYLRAFGRPPGDAESASCLAFLRRQCEQRKSGENDPAPWADLAHTLFNVKEFIFVR
jgi:cytochrome c553